MLYSIVLVGVTLTTAIKVRQGIYILDIDDGILKCIEPTQITHDIDLSSLNLYSLKKTAFDNVTNVRSLNLRNNSIEELPEFIFTNLKNLEILSLAENKLSKFNNTFFGLNNLKLLNISFNQINNLDYSYLFGLSNSTDIIVTGNELWSISTLLFENPFLRDKINVRNETITKNVITKLDVPQYHSLFNENNVNVILDKNLRIKICKTSDGLVESVEEIMTNETLTYNCAEVKIHHKHRKLILSFFGIEKFKKHWYKLHKFPFNSIELEHNNINELTSYILNDLPSDLTYVNFQYNNIKKLQKNVIKNNYLKFLHFGNNKIDEIEDNAFEETQLDTLFINGNFLKTIEFVRTLPRTVTTLMLFDNQIVKIPDNIFSNLKNLVLLGLMHNNISDLGPRSLSGLTSLQVLNMADNRLFNITRGAFVDLNSLRTLYLYRNSIRDLDRGVFQGLESLRDLNLAWNNLTRVTKTYFTDLPATLLELHLDFNSIETIEKGSFIGVPKFMLSLDHNKIKNFSIGTYDLPHLKELHIKYNLLETIDGASYEGLPHLQRLLLNGNGIKNIARGSVRNMGNLRALGLSGNKIERIENSALFGLPKIKTGRVYIADMRLKVIQSGMFENVEVN